MKASGLSRGTLVITARQENYIAPAGTPEQGKAFDRDMNYVPDLITRDGRTPERFYDALEWLYGWRAEDALVTPRQADALTG